MALREDKRAGTIIRTNLVGNLSLWYVSFESASTSTPDGVDPSGNVTLARTGVGDLTITFDAHVKPKAVLWGGVNIAENNATTDCKVGAYTASTGVLPLYMYTENGTSGISASADTNNLTYQCLFLVDTSSLQ